MKVTTRQLRKIIQKVIQESRYGRRSYKSYSRGYGDGGSLAYYEQKYGSQYVEDVLDDMGGDYGRALAILQNIDNEDYEEDSADW